MVPEYNAHENHLPPIGRYSCLQILLANKQKGVKRERTKALARMQTGRQEDTTTGRQDLLRRLLGREVDIAAMLDTFPSPKKKANRPAVILDSDSNSDYSTSDTEIPSSDTECPLSSDSDTPPDKEIVVPELVQAALKR